MEFPDDDRRRSGELAEFAFDPEVIFKSRSQPYPDSLSYVTLALYSYV